MPFKHRSLINILLISFLLSSCNQSGTVKAQIPSSNISSNSLSPLAVRKFLNAHNKVRAAHRLPPLTWSNYLSSYAQQWANELKKRNCKMKHRPNSGPFMQQFGENLFWASPLRWSNGKSEYQKISPETIVYDWASEQKFYNYRSNTCTPGEMCGHYTQIVWKTTKRVGCAVAQCGDYSQVWACNYDPPGNYIGERPY